MAIDTARKRASVTGFGFVLPADDVIDSEDRETISWEYGGVPASSEPIGGVGTKANYVDSLDPAISSIGIRIASKRYHTKIGGW